VEETEQVTLRITAPAPALRDALLAVDGVRAVDVRAGGDGGELIAECQIEARDGVEAAIARAVAGPWDLHQLERRQASLESIFLRYVQGAGGPAA
jgi:hypothetical protein